MNEPREQSPTPEEKRKADRHLLILYVAMAVMAVLPLLLLWLTRGKR